MKNLLLEPLFVMGFIIAMCTLCYIVTVIEEKIRKKARKKHKKYNFDFQEVYHFCDDLKQRDKKQNIIVKGYLAPAYYALENQEVK